MKNKPEIQGADPKPIHKAPQRPGYFAATKTPFASVMVAIPLLAAYEALVIWETGGGVRNGADVWLRLVLESLGASPRHTFALMLFGLLTAAPFLYRPDSLFRFRYLPGLVVEGLAYSFLLQWVLDGLFLGVIQGASWLADPSLTVTGAMAPGWAANLGQSLGAGLFEEFVFRGVLLGGALRAARGWGPAWARIGLISLGSAFLFALAHVPVDPHGGIGTYSFCYRLGAGLILGGIYAGRGFGVTAATHALYDIRMFFGG
ncbi:MAG: CPBP family intramembrane metalloprotease [Deltaproteobacteria bacterium]|nr:CPBP family intramembrane metalloprotease [Deltaproteobacteria bacterium]